MGTATEKQGGGSGGAASGARTAKAVGDGAQQDEANSIVARDRRFLLKPGTISSTRTQGPLLRPACLCWVGEQG